MFYPEAKEHLKIPVNLACFEQSIYPCVNTLEFRMQRKMYLNASRGKAGNAPYTLQLNEARRAMATSHCIRWQDARKNSAPADPGPEKRG